MIRASKNSSLRPRRSDPAPSSISSTRDLWRLRVQASRKTTSSRCMSAKNVATRQIARSCLEFKRTLDVVGGCCSTQACLHCYDAKTSPFWVYQRHTDVDKTQPGWRQFLSLDRFAQPAIETTSRSNAKRVSSTPAAGHFNRERSVQLY